MANTELILGLAGIGGTALAALGGNYATLAVERHRRRREDEAARQRLRKAVRLVQSDLEGAASKFEAAREHGRLWLTSEPITEGHLTGYREQLAAELDDPATWTAVKGAELVIDKVVTVLLEYEHQNLGERPSVEGPIVDLLALAADACQKAAEGLVEAEAALVRRR